MTDTGPQSQDQLCWAMSKAGTVEPMLFSHSGRGLQDSLLQWALFASALYPEACDLVLEPPLHSGPPGTSRTAAATHEATLVLSVGKSSVFLSPNHPSLRLTRASPPGGGVCSLIHNWRKHLPLTVLWEQENETFPFPSTQRFSLERRSVSGCELCLLIYIVSSQIKETMTYNSVIS